MRPSPEVLLTTGLALAGLTAIIGLGLAGWPGPTLDCSESLCFCERPRAGLVRQPANTWSNLGPIAAAVGLAFAFSARGARRSEGQRVVARTFPPVLVFQGVGSMLFHGGLTPWGAALDAMSMFFIIGALVATNLYRLGAVGPRAHAALFLGLSGLGLLVGLASGDLVQALMFCLFVTLLATEVVLSRRGLSRGPWRFRAGLGLHLAGVVVWFLSLFEGTPLCAPDSWLQGHAVWHLTAAGAVSTFAVHAWDNLSASPPPRAA